MKTQELLSVLKQKRVYGDIPDTVKGLEADSRKVKSDFVFVCIKGYTIDGHQFIESVIEKGAKVIIVETMPEDLKNGICYVQVKDSTRALAYLANAFYDYPSSKLRIIGVTGTNGKTSITNAINQALRLGGFKTGMMGTIELDINGTKYPSKNTTQDVLTLQKSLQQMVQEGVTDVVMEVSSHGLMLGRLFGVEFQNAVFTNLTQDHLDFHGSMENYKQAKSLLFSQLGQDLRSNKTAILNADDEASEYYKQVTSANVVTYGIDNDADYKAKNIRYYEDRTEFDLVYPNSKQISYPEVECHFVIPFVGKFNVLNLLSVIAALVDRGLDIITISTLLEHVQPAKGRMERIREDSKRHIFIDYAHTPDGVEKVLSSVKMFAKPNSKIYFVVGAGGNRDTKKRPIMGRLASEGADFVIFTTDNPRFEAFDSILSQLADGATRDNFECIADREAAIFRAIGLSNIDDIVVIAGKGHENYQIINGKEYHFNDKEVAIKAIKKYQL